MAGTVPTLSLDDLSRLSPEEQLEALVAAHNQLVQAQPVGLGSVLSQELVTVTVRMPPEVPAWKPLALESSWTDFRAGEHGVAGYRMHPDGTVELKGLLTGGSTTSGAVIATLPEGYRIAAGERTLFVTPKSAAGAGAVWQQGIASRIDVNINGTITGVNTDSSYIALTGIRYPAGNPAPADAFTDPGWPLLLRTNIRNPRALQVVKIEDAAKDAPATATYGCNAPHWTLQADGRLRITSMFGLTPARTYRVTFLVSG